MYFLKYLLVCHKEYYHESELIFTLTALHTIGNIREIYIFSFNIVLYST